MIQENIDNSEKRNNISSDLYDIYNKLGKYELWLAKNDRQLSLKTVKEDRRTIARLMNQYTSY